MRSLSVNIPIVSRNPWLGRVKPKKARSREECRHESRYSDTACTDSSAVDLVSIEDQFDSVKFEIETLGLVFFEYRCITCEACECNMVRGGAIQKGRIRPAVGFVDIFQYII